MATLTSPRALIEAGLAPQTREAEWSAVARRYAIAVPPALAALIDPADPHDPIARQVLPDARELDRAPHERDDPIGDDLKSPVRGLVHRYPDRVLLKLVSVCAVYCRFCFRRESVGPGGAALDEAAFAEALAYIRARPEIWEVVITGGDPLALSPRRLAQATRALADIAHVKVLRWHTRLPVAAPERVTEALAAALTEGHDKAVYVAVHANHARELTADARAACRRLLGAGVALVSQTVLLKGVNDEVENALADLMRAFVEDARKTLLPAPSRRGAGNRAFPRVDRARTGAHARVCEVPGFRPRACRPTCWTCRARAEKSPSGRPIWKATGPDYVAVDREGGRARLFRLGLGRVGGGDGVNPLGQRLLLAPGSGAPKKAGGSFAPAQRSRRRASRRRSNKNLELVVLAQSVRLADERQLVRLALDGHRLQIARLAVVGLVEMNQPVRRRLHDP